MACSRFWSLSQAVVAACSQELQEQWERARADEQSRGAGAADVKRWTGIRNTVEARELLRTLFVAASSQRAQVTASTGARGRLAMQVAGGISHVESRSWLKNVSSSAATLHQEGLTCFQVFSASLMQLSLHYITCVVVAAGV